MPTALELWRKRVPIVTVLERCDECKELKTGVERRDYWTPTGLISPRACAACNRALWREHYGGLTYQ